MAIVSAGYAGTVNDLQWSQMSKFFGMKHAIENVAACAVTQQGSTKTFNVAAGAIYGSGVQDISDAVVNVAPPVPGSGGQWFLIVARRVWATKITSFIAIAGATTSATPPTSAPVSLPAISSTPGSQDDQPIAYVWINASNTTVVIVDMRVLRQASGDPLFPSLDAIRLLIASPSAGDKARAGEITYRWSGAAWMLWDAPRTAYTPALQASTTNPNIGSTGTATGYYSVAEGVLRGIATFTFNGSGISNGSGALRITTPPIAPAVFGGTVVGGSALALDNGTAWHSGGVRIDTTTYMTIVGDAGQWGSATPIAAFAASDQISIEFEYWVA